MKSLKAAGVTTVLWTIDAPAGNWSVSLAAPFYDHVFCQGTEAVEILERAGLAKARWFPVGCDPSRHHAVSLSPEEKELYGNDVVFVGSWYPERAAFLEKLCDFDFAIWGPGWEMLPETLGASSAPQGRSHLARTVAENLFGKQDRPYPHYQDPSGRYPVYQASPRVFEAMACGAFVLCDRQRDVLALFRDGEHLACFSDGDDLAAKVRYYLEHPGERQAIARRGREEALSRHTYVHRLRELLAVAGERVAGTDHDKAAGEFCRRAGAGA